MTFLSSGRKVYGASSSSRVYTSSYGPSYVVPSSGYVSGATYTTFPGTTVTRQVTTSGGMLGRGLVPTVLAPTITTSGIPITQYATPGYVHQPMMVVGQQHQVQIPSPQVPAEAAQVQNETMQAPPQEAPAPAPAPMGMGVRPATMGMGVVPQQVEQKHEYNSSSAITVNNLHCAGTMHIVGAELVDGQNIFIGSAPFHMNAEDFEVSPEGMVLTKSADIKFHIAGIEEPLILDDLKELSGITDGDIHVGIPGQSSGTLRLENDLLMLTPDFKWA